MESFREWHYIVYLNMFVYHQNIGIQSAAVSYFKRPLVKETNVDGVLGSPVIYPPYIDEYPIKTLIIFWTRLSHFRLNPAYFFDTMSHYISKDPYRGEEKLVIALDIGTTQSERKSWGSIVHIRKECWYRTGRLAGVAFAHLSPGALPEVEMVRLDIIIIYLLQNTEYPSRLTDGRVKPWQVVIQKFVPDYSVNIECLTVINHRSLV